MGSSCAMASLLLPLLCASAASAAATSLVIDPRQVGPEFDGHGGLSAGGTSRLLIEYPEPERSQILDYLFLPGFAGALQVLKLEIGGDTQSTDGTETSHMHFRGDLGCSRGYEGWLAKEAKARNPDIKIWSLSWGVPGWIGNVSGNAPTYYCDDNIDYQIAWLRCLKDTWGVESDYLGLWNERPQGSTDYVVKLKKELEAQGFGHVGITVEATWEELIRKAVTDTDFNASIVAGSAHYPCNATENSEVTLQEHKKWWAGEDNTGGLGPDYHDLDRTGNWTGASCWGRKLNQHFIKMGATSTVAWSLIWSAAPGVSSNGILGTAKTHGFLGNGFLNATEPWSGHYDVPPVLWVNAHWHQFAQAGWRFLANATEEIAGGSGWLPGGGSYVTLVPPASDSGDGAQGQDYADGTFTMIVETLTGTCGSRCNTAPITADQTLSFELKGALASTSRVALWCSSESAVFVKQPAVTVTGGVLKLVMKPDMLCTATTLLTNGSKGSHPEAPASARFPKSYSDDFTNYTQVDTLARGFSDVYGSFAVRPTTAAHGSGGGSSSATAEREPRGQQLALTQVATAKPTGWAPTNLDPLTFIGDSMWTDVSITVKAMVNHSKTKKSEQIAPSPADSLDTAGAAAAARSESSAGRSSVMGGAGEAGEEEEERVRRQQTAAVVSRDVGNVDLRVGDPPPPPIQPDYIKVCGGCGDTSMHGLSYGCDEGCCFRIAYSGNWTLGHRGAAEGTTHGVISGFKDTWHEISVVIEGEAVTATVDGVKLGTVPGSCVAPTPIVFPGHGMVGLGCGAYHYCQFSSIKIEAK